MIESILLTGVLMLSPADTPNVPVQVLESGQKVSDGASLYRGRHYSAEFEELRKCIRWRESRNAYGQNVGKYRGAYQLSPAMGVGAGWMIQRELRRSLTKAAAERVGVKLRSTPVNNWAPFWQDMAFWIVWDNGAGRSHWAQTAYKVGSCK